MTTRHTRTKRVHWHICMPFGGGVWTRTDHYLTHTATNGRVSRELRQPARVMANFADHMETAHHYAQYFRRSSAAPTQAQP